MHRPTLLALSCLLFSILGVLTLLVSAAAHDHDLITQDQVFIAPFACAAVALISLILGIAHAHNNHDF